MTRNFSSGCKGHNEEVDKRWVGHCEDRQGYCGQVASEGSRLPVRVISEVVVIIRKGNGDKGKLESLGEPTRGSRDSSEDFIVVGRDKSEVSIDIVGSASNDHSATFSCLDRVIMLVGVKFFIWGRP